jgi:CheY-like chemotaxis protein
VEAAERPGQGAEVSEGQKPVTVLMADDDPDERLLTESAFRESRIVNELRFVEDGVELMDYLKRRGRYADPQQYPRPGLILLDLNMPRMDGREALQEIKSDPQLRRIPVVVLTTSRDKKDVYKTYSLGVNSFIVKPVSFDDLVELFKTLRSYWFEIVELPPPAP